MYNLSACEECQYSYRGFQWDNGIGILEEDLPRLFEEGFTGFNGHENQKATGLGLYMTKQILDSLNLAISITSQVDKGTQVTIALPKE